MLEQVEAKMRQGLTKHTFEHRQKSRSGVTEMYLGLREDDDAINLRDVSGLVYDI